MSRSGPIDLDLVDAYWRAANYLSAGQIYLLDNPLLTDPLTPEHIPSSPGTTSSGGTARPTSTCRPWTPWATASSTAAPASPSRPCWTIRRGAESRS